VVMVLHIIYYFYCPLTVYIAKWDWDSNLLLLLNDFVFIG
jgi:hypothetical protein